MHCMPAHRSSCAWYSAHCDWILSRSLSRCFVTDLTALRAPIACIHERRAASLHLTLSFSASTWLASCDRSRWNPLTTI